MPPNELESLGGNEVGECSLVKKECHRGLEVGKRIPVKLEGCGGANLGEFLPV